ncbi:MAG: isochorismatase [Phycisphaerales bacterium JB059]
MGEGSGQGMSAEAFDPGAAFAPRPTACRGVIEHAGYRLKTYEITGTGETLDRAAFDEGMDAALGELPRPAVTRDRPGLGFVIRNQGRDTQGRQLCYLVVCWWDNANELFIRTLLRGDATGGDWISDPDRASICVWDLSVIWHERNAYAQHVLAKVPDAEGYLGERFTQAAAQR